MEGFVQIDACLNRCEAIASDIAKALAVWKGASHVQNGSVVGTPRSDGLNDVKVDVAKVSELLKNETDVKKRKILKQYIQTQPSTLSEGTVLKDYQLLGVNWLNLLHSKRIGCILADEMGKFSDLPEDNQDLFLYRLRQDHPGHRVYCRSQGARYHWPAFDLCPRLDSRKLDSRIQAFRSRH